MAAAQRTNTAESLTVVWKKSSMAVTGSDGFSIFDSNGKLAFRIDNYARRNKYLLGELLLTNLVGRPLIVLKPQILSIHDYWNGYSSEMGASITASFETPIFTMKRRSILKNSDDTFEIFMHRSRVAISGSKLMEEADYQIQSCKIWGRAGKLVACISRKMVSPLVFLDEMFSDLLSCQEMNVN